MYASVCMPLYVCLCMYASVCMPLYVCLCMYASICMPLYVCLCMYASVRISVWIFYLVADTNVGVGVISEWKTDMRLGQTVISTGPDRPVMVRI